MQYWQLVNASPEYKTSEWGFELMLEREAFTSIPNSLKIGGKKFTVIVTGEEINLLKVRRD